MKIFAHGTKVETISGKYIGIITEARIRKYLITYEVSYFTPNGIYEKAILTESEFKPANQNDYYKVEIGFKTKQLPNDK